MESILSPEMIIVGFAMIFVLIIGLLLLATKSDEGLSNQLLSIQLDVEEIIKTTAQTQVAVKQLYREHDELLRKAIINAATSESRIQNLENWLQQHGHEPSNECSKKNIHSHH